MKLRVAVDHISASINIDSAWTPELIDTLLRTCGDEVLRVCNSLGRDDDSTAVVSITGGDLSPADLAAILGDEEAEAAGDTDGDEQGS